MVILTKPYGQLSNRFFQHIHLDSFCREHHISFYNSFLADVYPVYPKTKKHYDSLFAKQFMKMWPYLRMTPAYFDEEQKNEQYQSLICSSKFLCVEGWHFRSFNTTRKYRNFYQRMFSPQIDTVSLQKKWLSKKNHDEKIIGVHVRGEDYKSYAGGAYFFEPEVYVEKMEQLAVLLQNQCRFIIFTNEPALAKSAFHYTVHDISFSNNSASDDHYLMSQCDYIIGPPSTFALWASYIGETKYFPFYNKSDVINLNKFIVCDG